MSQHTCLSSALKNLEEAAHALSMTGTVEIILPLILDRIEELLSIETAAFLGIAQDGGDFVLLALAGSGVDYHHCRRGYRFHRPGTLLDQALMKREPVSFDLSSAPPVDPIVRCLVGDREEGMGLVIPLRVAGAERGGLILLRSESARGWEADIGYLAPFCDLAAVAIDRDRLRRARSDDATRLQVLNAVLQMSSAGLDEETLIRRTMEALLSSYPADIAELVTVDGSKLRDRFHYASRGTAGLQLGEAWRASLHRRVIEDGITHSSRGDRQGTPSDIHSIVCVPVSHQGRALGSLLWGRHLAPFEEWEQELLESVGGHLGIAIELSRVFRNRALEAEALEAALAEVTRELDEVRERLASMEESNSRIQSLASLGELAAGVAHDLNNALNPVVAFAELVQEHSDQPDRVQMYADRILLAARGGAETVRRIQRFTRRRLSDLPVETISVGEMVEQVIELTSPRWSAREAGSEIVIEQTVDPELRVQGNPGELRQALLNIVGNALDAMEHGGRLEFIGWAEGDEAVLSVRDTGQGMSPGVFDRALEPFFTTKGAHGTGLGLAEVYGIANRHGGNLELESIEGAGTTVTIRLPRTESEPKPVGERRRLTNSAARLYHILLVDDNLLSLEATAAALRAAGHTVATASNAQTALRVFNAGRYNLVLSDLGLPDMHGLELVDRIRLVDPNVRVGVITGWSLPEGDEELKRRGIDLLFVKPIDTERLLAEV